MVIFRLAKGVTAHFRSRITDWAVSGALAWTALIMLDTDQTQFSARAFAFLARLMAPHVWAYCALLLGLARLLALVINGTFPRYRAIVTAARGGLALVSTMFWLNIMLASLDAWPPPLSTGVWPFMLVLELYNVYLGALETADARNR
jgi:hypothetical protein